MNALRAPRPRTTRLMAGLATTALAVGGLASTGSAHAAVGPGTYPYDLGFTPAAVAVVGDAVYAVGSEVVGEQWDPEASTGYLANVTTGERLSLGEHTTATDVVAGDEAIFVLGTRLVDSTPEDEHGEFHAASLWRIGFGDLPETAVGESAPAGLRVDSLFATADGSAGPIGWVGSIDGIPTVATPSGDITLGHGTHPVAAAAAQGNTTYIAASATSDNATPEVWEDDYSVASLWRVVGEGEPTEVWTGGEGSDISDVVVDSATGVAYAAYEVSTDEGYSAGVAVVDGDEVREVPAQSGARTLALSPGGDTLYAATGWGLWSLDTDDLGAYTVKSPVPGGGSLPEGSAGSAIAVSADGSRVFLGDTEGNRMLALAAPSTAANISLDHASVHTDEAGGEVVGAELSWDASASTGGFDRWSMSYRVTALDLAGGEPIVAHADGTRAWFGALEPGHEYEFTVVAGNGAFESAPVATTFTMPQAEKEPEYIAYEGSVTITGTPVVGGTLTMHPESVTWPAGTEIVGTSWGWNGGEYGGAVPGATGTTLTLTPDLVGRTIVAVVTGRLAGYEDTFARGFTATTVAPAPVLVPGTLTTATPTITGKAKVGERLTAAVGTWTTGTALSYQWTANGKPIADATGSTLRLAKSHAGKRIAVVVTGTLAGYTSASTTSTSTAKVGAPVATGKGKQGSKQKSTGKKTKKGKKRKSTAG